MNQLSVFYPLCFQCHEMAPGVPLMGRFFLTSFLLEHFHPFLFYFILFLERNRERTGEQGESRGREFQADSGLSAQPDAGA